MRNPVERAFSHHRMFRRFQEEGRALKFKVNSFLEDVQKEISLIGQDGFKGEFVEPGLYLKSLKKWHQAYPKEQLTIFSTEELLIPGQLKLILQKLCRALSISEYENFDFINEKFNVAPMAQVPEEASQLLKEYYRIPNLQLEDYLGYSLNWD